jgi:hypothetical protein
MNEKLLVGIGVGVLSVVCGALVLRAGAQSTPTAVITRPSVGKTVMRMHCNACRVVRPETVEEPVVLQPQRYWRGQLPIPSGYTHWVPPVDDYARYAPDLPVIPLPEILRGSRESRQGNVSPSSGGGRYRSFGEANSPSVLADPGVQGFLYDIMKRDEARDRERDMNDMLKDYRQNKNKQ